MLHELPDGGRIELRFISPDDKVALTESHLRLSEATIRSRFLSPKPRLTAGDLRYLTEVDGVDHVAIVAIDPDDTHAILGVARFIRHLDDATSAEVAIVVEDSHQRRGIGTVLAAALADAARARQIEHLTATALVENVAIRRLMLTVAEQLELDRDGAIAELVADLAA